MGTTISKRVVRLLISVVLATGGRAVFAIPIDVVSLVVPTASQPGSADCDGNGLPDECDLDCGANGGACDQPGCGAARDCNGNGLPDSCDLVDGTSEDCPDNPLCACEPNGVPSECEPGQFRLFMVPAGEDPAHYAFGTTEVEAFASVGSTMSIEVFAEYAPDLVRGVQTEIHCQASGGNSGSIRYANGSARVDDTRDDYLFSGVGIPTIIDFDQQCNPHFRSANALVSGGVQLCEAKYLYTLDLLISPDATGTFQISFLDAPDGETVFSNPDIEPMETPILSGLLIHADATDCNNNSIADACELDCAAAGGVCNVAGCGIATDCNVNDIPDACDIESGFSVDCNQNGVPDTCDLAEGTSTDCGTNPACGCTSNGIPDECEPSASRIFFVPAGADPLDYPTGPTMIDATGMAGDSLGLDVFIAGSPTAVRGVNWTLRCASFGAGTGTISYVIDSGEVDVFRPDYLHFGVASFGVVDQFCSPDLRVLVARLSGGSATCSPKYVGHIDLQLSDNALGTFSVEFVMGDDNLGTIITNPQNGVIEGLTMDPLIVNVNCESSADCNDDNVCTFDVCVEGRCQRIDTLFGDVAGPDNDCAPDGKVDIWDIAAIFTLVSETTKAAGDFESDCSEHNFDLSSLDDCLPDGEINLYDMHSIVSVFHGIEDCCVVPQE